MKSRMSSNNVVLNSFGCMLGKYKSCYQRYSLTPIPPSLTPAPPVMAATTAAVAAISTALSALHLTRTTTTTTTYHTLRSLSSHRLFSSSPSTTSQFTLKNPLSSSSNADEDSPQEQLSIPWNVHAHRAARYLQAMADVKTQKKEKKKVEKGKVREEPKYSKAARRFYNERFRDAPERLSKVLAASGVASRRHSEELIFEGKVTVNGSVCNTPQTKVDPARDVIYVNGNRLPKKLPSKVYLALNKPKGYICSSGEKEFKSALCLFDDYLKSWEKRNPGEPKPRLFTAGRLDVATTGLIIVTNDGEFAQKISHPSHNLTKEYIATINGAFHKKHLVAISEGKNIDGRHCTPESVELLPREPDMLRTRLRIVVHEGRNHEVRELVKNAGLEIHSLKRTRIGGFRLPFDLGLGKHIELKPNDLKALGWTS